MKCSIAVAYPEALPTAPFLFRGDWKTIIDQAKNCGYDGIELHLRHPKEIDAASLRSYIESKGMEFSAVATGMSYTIDKLSMIAPDETERAAALQRLREYVDLAQILGCHVIIGSIRGNLPASGPQRDAAAQYFRQSLRSILTYAQERNVTLVIEAINRYENNYFNSVGELFDFVQEMGFPNLMIHADTFHMSMEESGFPEAFRKTISRLGYLHVADTNRRYLGAGMLDTDLIARCLRECGYEGWISLECLPYPDAQTAAEKSISVMRGICA